MMRRRRRPLLRAAAVGGTAYAVGKHHANSQNAQAATDAQQDANIQDLQQQPAAPPQQYAAPPPTAPPAAEVDLSAQLTNLGQLHASGVLTDEEFEAAKQKILQG